MAEWMDLTGKVIIVTGGSRGIGEHVVKILRRNNATVIVADLTPNPDYESDENILFINCNVAKKDSVDAMVKEVIDKYGKIDGLLNNAGVSRPRLLVDFYGEKPEYELSEDDFDFMVSINQKGVFLCSQAVARHMIKQKNGVIVNMSSEAGMQGSKGQSCYSGTKGAVLSYTMSWAKELGPFNIRVVGVAPSINERTPMNDDAAFAALAYTRGQDPNNVSSDYEKVIPMGRAGKLDEVADLICYLFSDRASYISGTTINISGAKSTR